MRNALFFLGFAVWLAVSSGLEAADDSWAIADFRLKEIRLTLKTGEVIQGAFSADTKDKVMMTVITPKGKNSQTVNKVDVAKHEWVKPAETEYKEKLEAWPAQDFEQMLTFGQELIDKGYKKVFFDFMRAKQKDLTAEQFKLYAFVLLNNDMINDAKDLIAWAKAEHEDWEAEIAEAVGRIPKGPKVTTTGTPGQKPEGGPDLLPGQIYIAGRTPVAAEQTAFVEDAKKRLVPEPKMIRLLSVEQLSLNDPEVLLLTFEASWDLSANKSGKIVKYQIVMIYTVRSPKVYQFKSAAVGTWPNFPNPVP